MTDRSFSLAELTPATWLAGDGTLDIHIKSKRPNNWRDYLQAAIDTAKSTGATDIRFVGAGLEGTAYELLRDGKSLWTVMRIQCGSVPHPEVDGTLPFYSDEQIYIAGDPSNTTFQEPEDVRPSNLGAVNYIYGKGMRVTLMPLIVPEKILADENGVCDGVTDEEFDMNDQITDGIDGLIARQGYIHFDDHAKNRGFYALGPKHYVPVVFDPGPRIVTGFPESVSLGSTDDRWRRKKIASLPDRDVLPFTAASTWKQLRDEIASDGERLLEGKPTAYALRMNRFKAEELTPEHAIRCALSPEQMQR